MGADNGMRWSLPTGAGSVMESLALKKHLVVVVNTALMDDHQRELGDALEAQVSKYPYCCWYYSHLLLSLLPPPPPPPLPLFRYMHVFWFHVFFKSKGS